MKYSPPLPLPRALARSFDKILDLLVRVCTAILEVPSTFDAHVQLYLQKIFEKPEKQT